MNILRFPPIKISLANELETKDFLLRFLEDSADDSLADSQTAITKNPVSIDTLDESSWVKLYFSPRRRKLAGLLSFFLISSKNLAASLSKKLKQNVEKIDVNRLLYDLFFYCQQKEKGVVFLGFDQKEQIAIKKNLSAGKDGSKEKKFFSLSLYFLSNLQLRAYGEENVRVFLKKMQPRLVICNDAVFFSSFGGILFDIFQKSNFLFFLIDKKTKNHLAAKYSKKSRFYPLIYLAKILYSPFSLMRFIIVCPFKLVSILAFHVTLRRAVLTDRKQELKN